MRKQFKSLFVFLILGCSFFSTFAQKGRSIGERPNHYQSVHESSQKFDLSRRREDVLKEGDPYKEKSSEQSRIDYCRVQYELLEQKRINFFSNPKNYTEDISKLFIFISNVPLTIQNRRNDKEYNETKFYSNYGTKLGNAHDIEFQIKLGDYKKYNSLFKSSFGDNSVKDIIKNAHFVFEIGSAIGKNEREILALSKRTYLQLPGKLAECVYNEKNNKLYYRNGNHFMEAPKSIEDYFIVKEAIEREMNFEKNIIISFVDDRLTEEKLKRNFGGSYIKIDNQKKLDGIEELLISHKNDRIILVGHMEDNAFASNNKNKFDFNLSLDKINQIQADNSLFLNALGCNSIENGSNAGFSNNVNSTKVADAVYSATQKKTYREFFDAMSVKNSKFFVNTQSVGNQIRFEAEFKEYQQKVTKEINEKIERKGEISKAIVYSKLIEVQNTSKADKETIHDANTALNFLFRALGIVIVILIIFWLFLKLFLYSK
ncbi:hypothetical protein [Flavobacterium notoginsengisoli]|uniref:hypothetical protein n=1 Tax=Flavobacterium notoginsengisoli TaxID=1478199 RepID=UPI00364466D2